MSGGDRKASDELPSLVNLIEANTDPNDHNLHFKLYKFANWLEDESFALDFLGCGGVSALISVIKMHQTGHTGLAKLAIGAFLNLLCHLSVVASISLKVDQGLIIELVKLTYATYGAFTEDRINRANTLLHILVDNSTNGPEYFHEAVRITSDSRGIQPYSHFVRFLRSSVVCQSTLQLLECTMRNSVLHTFTDDMISMLRDCNIVESLNCMKAISICEKGDLETICQFSKLFGDTSEKVAWFQARAPCHDIENHVNGIMRANSTLDDSQKDLEVDILHKVKRRIATRIEVELNPYDDCLWKLEQKVEQTHLENLQRCNSVSGCDISEKQRLENISEEYRQVLPCFNVISERNAIRRHRASWSFYQSLQLNLNHIMVALQCIKSGFIEQADAKPKILEKTIRISGEAVPLPGINAAATIVNSTMKWFRRSKRKKQNAKMATVAINSAAMEKISEACARLVTFRYAEQLNMISTDSAKSLGAYGARLILEGLRSGCLEDMDVSYESSQTDIVSRLANLVSAGASDASKTEKKISVLSDKIEDWDQNSVFTSPGLIVDGVYYDGGRTDSYRYGYRLGSYDDVDAMGLSQSTCRVQSLVHRSSLSKNCNSNTPNVRVTPTRPSDIVVKGDDAHTYMAPYIRKVPTTTSDCEDDNELSELLSLVDDLQQQKKEQMFEICKLKQQVRNLITEARNLLI